VLRGRRDSSDRRARGGVRRVALLATALATVFVAVGASSGCVARTERFELALIGDLPYTPEDEAKFPALIEEMNVIPDFREPDNIRLGFASLYTSFEEAWEGFDRIKRVMTEKRYEKYPKQKLTVT